MQLGLGFWGSKALLSAVELGLFTELRRGAAGRRGAARAAGPAPRGARRTSSTRWWRWACSSARTVATATRPTTDLFLDRAKPSYVGGILEMANARLYAFWGSLTRGPAHRGAAERGEGAAATSSRRSTPTRSACAQFLRAMTGHSLGAAHGDRRASSPGAITARVIDIGCAQGAVPVQIALAHEHITGGGFDLPAVGPIFDDYVAELRARRSPALHRRRLLRRPAAHGGRAGDGAHPARLGPRREAASARQGVRGAARRAGR